jgi:hypothetical protein
MRLPKIWTARSRVPEIVLPSSQLPTIHLPDGAIAAHDIVRIEFIGADPAPVVDDFEFVGVALESTPEGWRHRTWDGELVEEHIDRPGEECWSTEDDER